MPNLDFSRLHFFKYLSYLPEKIGFDTSCESSPCDSHEISSYESFDAHIRFLFEILVVFLTCNACNCV